MFDPACPHHFRIAILRIGMGAFHLPTDLAFGPLAAVQIGVQGILPTLGALLSSSSMVSTWNDLLCRGDLRSALRVFTPLATMVHLHYPLALSAPSLFYACLLITLSRARQWPSSIVHPRAWPTGPYGTPLPSCFAIVCDSLCSFVREASRRFGTNLALLGQTLSR
jgi:hypothetical protein